MSTETFVIGVADLRDYMMDMYFVGSWNKCQYLCYAVDAFAAYHGVESLGDYESVVLTTMSGWMGRKLESDRRGIADCFSEDEQDGFVQRGVDFCRAEYRDDAQVNDDKAKWNVMLRIGMLLDVLDKRPYAKFVFSVEE